MVTTEVAVRAGVAGFTVAAGAPTTDPAEPSGASAATDAAVGVGAALFAELSALPPAGEPAAGLKPLNVAATGVAFSVLDALIGGGT